MKPAPFCSLFASLGSPNKSAIFSLSLDALALYLSLCSLLHLSFYLKLSSRYRRNCLLSHPLLWCYNGSSDTYFSWVMRQLMNWHGRVCYFWPVQCLVVSLLLPLISTHIFSQTGGILFNLNSLTHRSSWCLLRNLCSLVMLTVYCSQLSRVDIVENPSCIACRHLIEATSHCILHCPAMNSLHLLLFGNSLSFYDLWSRLWRVTSLLGIHHLLLCLHLLEGVG